MVEPAPRPSPVLVVADDLTGANATGVLLVKAGLRGLTLLSPDTAAFEVAERWVMAAPADPGGSAPAVMVSTDSRAVAPAEASRRVRLAFECAIRRFGAPRLVSKRIDSTARGNVGPEVGAALDVLGPGAFAVVTPAYPASGRQVVGGYLLVNGVPVVRTGAARDPLAPVRQAHMPALLRDQQPLPVGHLELNTVLAGPGAILAELERMLKAGQRIVVSDAASNDDLEAVAEAIVQLLRLGHFGPAVCADPGPLTAAAVVRFLGGHLPGSHMKSNAARPAGGAAPAPAPVPPAGAVPGPVGPVLVVAGSATELTRVQLDAVESRWNVTLASVDVGRLIGRGTARGDGSAGEPDTRGVERAGGALQRRLEIERLAAHLASRWADPVTGLRTSHTAQDVVQDLTPAEKEALLGAVGEAVRTVLEERRRAGEPDPAGLYLTGGDVTAAVVRALGAAAVELLDEVLPLAAHGRLVGGAFHGTALVTKGGLVGDEQAAVRCVERLMRAGRGIEARARFRSE